MKLIKWNFNALNLVSLAGQIFSTPPSPRPYNFKHPHYKGKTKAKVVRFGWKPKRIHQDFSFISS